MKKIIVFFICLMVIVSFTACGNTNAGELDELREEVYSLQEKVDEFKNSTSSKPIDDSTVPSGSNSTSTSNESINTNEQNSPYLDELLFSTDPNDWLKVAKSNLATEEQLSSVAKKAAILDYYATYAEDRKKQVELATALSKNSATTPDIMEEISKAENLEVWQVVANSNKAGETALTIVAKAVASLEDNEKKQLEVAKSISANPAATAAVMAELATSEYPEVWEIVASSEKSDEKALLRVAQNCITLNYYYTYAEDSAKQVEITKKLAENQRTTNTVMTYLLRAENPEVEAICKKWLGK